MNTNIIKMPNGMVFIGGAFGTLIEIAHSLKMLERRLKPKYSEEYPLIVPISGVGGSSDLIHKLASLSGEVDVAKVLPQAPIRTGSEAALYDQLRFKSVLGDETSIFPTILFLG